MNISPSLTLRRFVSFVSAASAAFLLVVAVSAQGRDPMAWKLRIAPAAAVSGERVLLGEIAEPVGEIAPETWRILATTPLWSFPGREGQMTLTRAKILDDLDTLFPNAASNFTVPEQVVLKKGGGKPVATNEVNKMIVDYLTANMTGVDGELEVKEIVLPTQLFLDPETEKLTVETVGTLAPGRVNLRLTIASPEGRTIRQISGNAFVNLWKVIPVAGRPLNMRDGALTTESVTFERRNLAFVRGLPWDPKNPQPMRAKTSLNQGTPLTSETVEPMPAITKGEQITCLWRGSHIQLTMPVTAVTDGAKGGQITVRNVQGGKEIAAIVQDNKTVLAR